MKQFFKNIALLIGGFFKKYAFTLGIFIVLIVVLIEYIKSLLPDGEKEIKPKSKDKVVDSAIFIIDEAFNSVGTFNFHHEPIFEVIKKLSKSQLIRLHEDFGYRYYNSITRKYALVQLIQGYAVARPENLNSLYNSELDEVQIARLSVLYKSKGLVFPYL
ncbi:hypothetical protein [Tenacibaculum ovolyticum]|uniref:hypothetical protein n=1 Tax=Tenacibaculum ovolyticum TaxID=104270 RepID=UPI003BAC0BAB